MTDKQENKTNTSVTVRSQITTAGAGKSIFVQPTNLSEMIEVAKIMSLAGPAVGIACRNNPHVCFAIASDAYSWGMDPFKVSRKCYLTVNKKTGQEMISYEAQLISGVINALAPIKGRLMYRYKGQGDNLVCIVSAIDKETGIKLEYTSPPLSKCKKHSPLWYSDPEQQLSYYAARAFCRRHYSDLLMGVYTPDEIHDSPPLQRRDDTLEQKLKAIQDGTSKDTMEITTDEPKDEDENMQDNPKDAPPEEKQLDDVQTDPEPPNDNLGASKAAIEDANDVIITSEMQDWFDYLDEAEDPTIVKSSFEKEAAEQWRKELTKEQDELLQQRTDETISDLYHAGEITD